MKMDLQMFAGGGFSKERVQFRMLAQAVVPGAFDLTGSAAGTSISQFVIPKEWFGESGQGQCKLRNVGFKVLADSGAVTTEGSIRLYKNGTAVGSATATTAGSSICALPASTSAGAMVEKDLNTSTNTLVAGGAPTYPTCDNNDKIEVKVEVQGVGGTQSISPYLLVSIDYP